MTSDGICGGFGDLVVFCFVMFMALLLDRFLYRCFPKQMHEEQEDFWG